MDQSKGAAEGLGVEDSAYLARAREWELNLRSHHAVGAVQPVCCAARSHSARR
jgi:hypothetical protein